MAVIDLGSNSFRMVVFSDEGGAWEREHEISRAVRIGEGLAANGRLGRAAIERGLSALEDFADLASRCGLDERTVDAVATSAIRDADNGREFLRTVHERFGMRVRVLGREQEARYAYLAAVNSTMLTDGCVLDLGGGSLQLVRVVGRLEREMGSWRLGAVRMTERFLSDPGPAQPEQVEALRAHVARKLGRAPWLAGAGPRLIGMGGTVRNLALAARRIAPELAPGPAESSARADAGAPDGRTDEVHGFVIARPALDDLVERLAALPAHERAGVPGIKAGRADIVLAGAIVVQSVLAAGDFPGVEVTGAGLREGVFFERQLAQRRLHGLLDWPRSRAA